MRDYHTHARINKTSCMSVWSHMAKSQVQLFSPLDKFAILLGPRSSWIFCMLATSCSNLRPTSLTSTECTRISTPFGSLFVGWTLRQLLIYIPVASSSYIMNTQRKKKHTGGLFLHFKKKKPTHSFLSVFSI